MTVGILALQGSFQEHAALLHHMGVPTVLVRLPEQLAMVERLIIPGGESTTLVKLLNAYKLFEPICQRAKNEHFPILGTCAGAILMASFIVEGGTHDQTSLGVMDMSVRRNGYGRQIDSFETDIHIPVLGEAPLHTVFIRAPRIDTVGDTVEVLARLPSDETIVAARQGHLLAATFHPELTSDDRMHRYFLEL